VNTPGAQALMQTTHPQQNSMQNTAQFPQQYNVQSPGSQQMYTQVPSYFSGGSSTQRYNLQGPRFDRHPSPNNSWFLWPHEGGPNPPKRCYRCRLPMPEVKHTARNCTVPPFPNNGRGPDNYGGYTPRSRSSYGPSRPGGFTGGRRYEPYPPASDTTPEVTDEELEKLRANSSKWLEHQRIEDEKRLEVHNNKKCDYVCQPTVKFDFIFCMFTLMIRHKLHERIAANQKVDRISFQG